MDDSDNVLVPTKSDLTSNLPVEVLATIFDIACRLFYSSDELALGAVCSRWRQIIWSSPRFWADSFGCTEESNPGVVELFKLYAKNARSIPLSIEFYSVSWPRNPLTFVPLFYLMFNEYSHCIQSLVLCHMGKLAWEVIRTYSRDSEFRQLDSLHLAFDLDVNPDDLTPWNARLPALKHLVLYNPKHGIFNAFRFDRITSLELNRMHPNHVVHILSHCSGNLVKFKAGDVDTLYPLPDSVPSSVPAGDLMMSTLTHFDWDEETRRGPNNIEFIHHIRLPVLRHLTLFWKYDENPHIEWDQWEEFLRQLENIETIELTTTVNRIIARMLILFSTQPIRRMDTTMFSPDEVQASLSFLTLDHDDKVLPFARLEVLILRNDETLTQGEIIAFLDSCIRMLRSRRQSRDPSMPQIHSTPLRRFEFLSPTLYCFLQRSLNSYWELCRTQFQALRQLRDDGLELSGDIMGLILRDEREES